jgi:transcriptional regulator with PAS, ATPase and Fis domain
LAKFDIYKKIVTESYDAIMVTDKNGVIVVANQATADSMHLTIPEMIGKTPGDMITAGVYYNSTILEALKSKQTVTRIINLPDHKRLSTSIPLLNEDGDVFMVLTNSRSDDILNEYARQLAYEKEQHARYREIADYLASLKEKELIYKSREMGELVTQCAVIAEGDSAVLISGESGVGKELMAHMVHDLSGRKNQAFIPVNCSAIPAELFESEFFGYKPGAFTGANAKGKIGLIQMAHKGTLFLDEVGELPLLMQCKLLRFVESGEIYPIGSSTPEKVDVRIISATNRNLFEMVQEKTFREDLYYRLNVIPLSIPPLRERPADIGAIAVFFLNKFNKKYDKQLIFSDEELEILQNYSWPGNVRELRNAIERLVLLSSPGQVKQNLQSMLYLNKKGHSPLAVIGNTAGSAVFRIRLDLPLKDAMEQFEADYVHAVLKKHQGRLGEASQALGIHRTTLYRKQREIGATLYNKKSTLFS